MAGASPNSTPAVSDTIVVNPSVRRSSAGRAKSSMPGGTSCSRKTIAPLASRTPTTRPSPPRTRLSASSCRTMRLRVAPSELRRAISCRRAVARASSRLATFAQAMSITTPTAANSTTNGRRASPATYSRRDVTCMRKPSAVARQVGGQSSGEALQVRLRLLDAHRLPEARDDGQLVRAARQLLGTEMPQASTNRHRRRGTEILRA